MTATDELRRMLDERGVRHYDTPNGTCWGYLEMPLHGRMYTHYAVEVDSLLCVDSHCITPEQAIADTLGRGECKQEEGGWSTEGDHARVWLTCGHDCMVETVADLPNFCPVCGAKVVEPTTNDVDAEVDDG